MPRYMIPLNEIGKLKPKGKDKKRGYKLYNVILGSSYNSVLVETHEEYEDLKDYEIKE